MRYQNRISGPLLDRIDIHVEVPRVDYEKLSSDRMGEPSTKIRERVEQARERQRARFSSTPLQYNGEPVIIVTLFNTGSAMILSFLYFSGLGGFWESDA